MKVRKLTAVALGATTVAAPTAAAAQEDPGVVAPAEDPAAVAAAEQAAAAPSCTAGDYRIVKTDTLTVNNSGTGQSGGTVELWYSPSTRCVFGQVKANAGASGVSGKRSYAAVIRVDEVHNTHQVVDCTIPAGQRSCATPRIYDGEIPDGGGRNFKAAAGGDFWVGGPPFGPVLWSGKTAYY